MRIRSWLAGAGAALAVGLGSVPAVAQTAPRVHALRWDPPLDVAVTAFGAAVWVVSEVLKADLAPSRCRWCDVDALDAGVRNELLWRDPAPANTVSNLLAFAVMPLAAVGLDALAAAHEGAQGDVPEDAILVAEATIVTADVDQVAKLVIGRERPFVHALPPAEKRLTPRPSDNNLSFFSGHTSAAFALAAASGTIATLRGYRWAPLEWSVGGAVAASTAYFRIAADKHWLTDTLVGMVVGAGIGFAVPYFFHSAAPDSTRASSAALRVPALPAGGVMTLTW